MKKLIFFLIILVVNVFGQDVNRVVNTTFYRDTLTATKDTIQLKFQAGFDYFTISTYSAATDTIYVYTKGEGNYGIWTQKALIDLSNSSISTQIISTSTPKEYLIQVPSTMWLLIITPDGSANTVFTVNAYKGLYAINGSTPSTLPLPSGAATSSKQDSIITLLNSQIIKLLNISANSDSLNKYIDYHRPFYMSARDSIQGTGTKIINFGHKYFSGYISISNPNATPDTLKLLYYSVVKGDYTSQAVRFVDVATGFGEVDNTTVIIPANTAKIWRIDIDRPNQIKIEPKVTTSARRNVKNYIIYRGANL